MSNPTKTQVFDPEWGNPSLRTIYETPYPDAVAFIPETPGWWLVLLLLLAWIARLLWHRHQRYLRNRYRREALTELAAIKQRIDAGAYEAVRELAPLLRATAIAAVGRRAMVELSDQAYAQALTDLAPNQPAVSVKDLQALAYAPLESTKAIDHKGLITALECWITHHRLAHPQRHHRLDTHPQESHRRPNA